MGERTRIAFLLVIAALVYGNTLANGFALDDGIYIVGNPAVTHFSVSAIFQPNKESNVFRPATFATFALNWALGGEHSWGYHALNLLLHALVTLLLYLVLKKLLESYGNEGLVAWVAALLFAVHPIHADAVASIVGRAELLAAGFILAAWLLHLNDRPIFCLLCFVAALLSKESAPVFVPLVILGDYARDKARAIRRYAWIAGTAVLYVAALWKIQGGRFGQTAIPFTENPLAFLPANLRMLNAIRVAWKYIGLQAYPAKLSCDYSFNSIPVYATWSHTWPPAVAALLMLALWAWSFRAKRMNWFLAGAIYLGGFAVTANILLATGTIMGERLAYLPSAGFCLLVALLWAKVKEYKRELGYVLLVMAVSALAIRTVVRNRDWRDNFSLFSAAAHVLPANASIHDGLAGEYKARGEWAASFAETQETVGIYPDFPEELRAKGITEAAFRLWNIAAEHVKAGEDNDALAFVNLAIAKCPNFSLAWSTRAVVRFRQGERTPARQDAEHALQLDPANVQARYLLNVLASQGANP